MFDREAGRYDDRAHKRESQPELELKKLENDDDD